VLLRTCHSETLASDDDAMSKFVGDACSSWVAASMILSAARRAPSNLSYSSGATVVTSACHAICLDWKKDCRAPQRAGSTLFLRWPVCQAMADLACKKYASCVDGEQRWTFKTRCETRKKTKKSTGGFLLKRHHHGYTGTSQKTSWIHRVSIPVPLAC